MAAALTDEQRALKAACAKLAKALKGCTRMSDETKARHWRECAKIGAAS